MGSVSVKEINLFEHLHVLLLLFLAEKGPLYNRQIFICDSKKCLTIKVKKSVLRNIYRNKNVFGGIS